MFSIRLLDSEQLSNATEVYRFFKEKGWTDQAICGMLGNMMGESSLYSWRFENEPPQYGTYDNYQYDLLEDNQWGNGYGLLQWSPPYNLISWCKQMGLKYWTVNAQCLYTEYELSTSQQWKAYNHVNFAYRYYNFNGFITNFYGFTIQDYISSTDQADHLAIAWELNFERPAIPWESMHARAGWASTFYAYFVNQSPNSSFAPQPVPSSPSPSYADGSYYPPAANGRYTVQPGNTLSGIAAHFRVTAQDLCRRNGIQDPNRIYAGDAIYVTPHNPSPSGKITVEIQPGDTLWGIAREYGVTVRDIMDWNKNVISDPNLICPGTVIRV